MKSKAINQHDTQPLGLVILILSIINRLPLDFKLQAWLCERNA